MIPNLTTHLHTSVHKTRPRMNARTECIDMRHRRGLGTTRIGSVDGGMVASSADGWYIRSASLPISPMTKHSFMNPPAKWNAASVQRP